MKTTQEIIDKIIEDVIINRNMGDKEILQLLKEWAYEIVEECADSFEYTMEADGDAYTHKYQVLVRQSVLNVKYKIK